MSPEVDVFESIFLPRPDLQEFHGKVPRITLPGVRKGQVYEGMGEFLKTFGADDRQGFFPSGHKIMIQEDKRQSEAMVAVEMADEDVLDILQGYSQFPDGRQSGGGGFKKYPPVHQETSIGPSGGEGIARAQEKQLDVGLFFWHGL